MTVTSPTPIIVHHMAAQNPLLPPNSHAAVLACLEANAAVIEVDIVALAADDYLLVHDMVLENETTGQGEVSAIRPDEAAQLFYRDGQGNPTQYPAALLSQIVQLLVDYGGTTRIQLDYKNVIPFATLEPLQRLINIIAPLRDRVIVSSGADWQLRRLRHLAPELALGLDVHFAIDWRTTPKTDPCIPPYRLGAYGYWDDYPVASARYMPTADYLAERCAMLVNLVPRLSTFYIDHKLLVQSLDDGFNWAAALHDHGLTLDAWTLDSHNPVAVANAQRLQQAGLDYLTTNTPDAMAQLLAAPPTA